MFVLSENAPLVRHYVAMPAQVKHIFVDALYSTGRADDRSTADALMSWIFANRKAEWLVITRLTRPIPR